MKTLVSCYEINFDDFIMLLEKFVLNDEHIHWKKIDPMSSFFNSCVAVTRSDHSVAQLRVAVSQ